MLVAQLCLTLCNPMDCTLPTSSLHGILQARILEWVAIPFSRGSSQPRDQTQVSHTAGGLFTIWATREALRGVRWRPKEGKTGQLRPGSWWPLNPTRSHFLLNSVIEGKWALLSCRMIGFSKYYLCVLRGVLGIVLDLVGPVDEEWYKDEEHRGPCHLGIADDLRGETALWWVRCELVEEVLRWGGTEPKACFPFQRFEGLCPAHPGPGFSSGSTSLASISSSCAIVYTSYKILVVLFSVCLIK